MLAFAFAALLSVSPVKQPDNPQLAKEIAIETRVIPAPPPPVPVINPNPDPPPPPPDPHLHGQGNHFPWGWCTWGVANIRDDIAWTGNAWQWFGEAKAFHYPTGQLPRAGAVMVTWENPYYGHVAYVTKVNPDGSWVVKEMNYLAFGMYSYRTIYPGGVPLIGFIY